jgi:phage-related protein (TIGR01555 family)
MISNYSTSGLATNLQATLEEEGMEAGGMSLFKRAAMFNQMRDNRGIMLLDNASEEFFQFNTPLSGLGDLQAQAQEHMAAPLHIPLVKLTGVSPAGLNASSEGEIKVFYDYVGAEQKDFLNGHLVTVLKVLQLHLWGKVNPKISFEWVRLDSPTDKEESEMRKADADRDAAYVTNAVVSADEVRQRLRNDKNSGYTFLKGPAPAPELDDAALQEEGKDADHARNEESADADHERAKDMEAHKAKLAPKPAAKAKGK